MVTHQRRPILTSELARSVLREAVTSVQEALPFAIEAWVLLPDHLHAIWTLPAGDCDFSTRWGRIKRQFSVGYLDAGGVLGAVSDSQQRHRRSGIWQRRFWEHTIASQDDFNRCMDYVMFNPVRHGLARCPHDWPWSSFGRLVERGVYEARWSCGCGGGEVNVPVFPEGFGGE